MQGNAAANAAFEQVATGCLKPIGPVSNPENAGALLDSLFNPVRLLSSFLTSPQNTILVPGDPNRRFVSKKQYKDVFKAGKQADGHGFDLIDAAQETASKGAAGYYAWSPTPGMRFIALDTVAEAGTILTPSGASTSDGNIDNPQFKWLRGQLQAATAADQLVVLFSHHAPESLVADVPDELAPPCTVNDSHGHDVNPGCDLDPRFSFPIHLEADLVALLHEFPNAIAWVAGHSHDNVVNAFPNPGGSGGFWSIRVAAEADWPQQSRLLEVFDNHDGTLSIFGTILDHIGQAAAPAPGTPASVDGPQRPRLSRADHELQRPPVRRPDRRRPPRRTATSSCCCPTRANDSEIRRVIAPQIAERLLVRPGHPAVVQRLLEHRRLDALLERDLAQRAA